MTTLTTKLNYNKMYSREEIILDLADKKKYHPSWLIVEPKEFANNQSITIRYVPDEVEKFKIGGGDDMILLNYYENTKNLTHFSLRKEDIGYLWYGRKILPGKDKPTFEMTMMAGYGALEMLDSNVFYNYRILEDRYDAWKKNIEKDIARYNVRIKDKKNIYNILARQSNVEFSDFTKDAVEYETIYNNSYDELIYLFNEAKLNANFPFMAIKAKGQEKIDEWYKFYSPVVFQTRWLAEYNKTEIEKNDNQVMFLVYANEGTEIFFKFTYERIMFEINYDEGELLELILKSITELMSNKIKIINENPISVKAHFDIEDVPFNKAIMLDMVFNDDLLSYFLTSDEGHNNKAGMVKGSGLVKSGIGLLFLVDNKQMKINVSLNISETGKLIAKISKGKSQDAVNHFLDIFSKLLNRYKEEYETIGSLYKELIPSFNTTSLVNPKREKLHGYLLDRLRENQPDLFLERQYGKMCGPDSQPTIATENEIQTLDPDEMVMEYPADSGVYYTCNLQSSKKKYIGLKLNTMTNKNYYEYVPCCFVKPSMGEGSKYHDYMNELESTNESKRNRLIKNPGRIVGPNKEGVLVSNIEIIFSKLKTNGLYRRYGFTRSKHSLLSCLEYGKGNESPNFKKIREQLKKYYEICRQEMYDYDREAFEEYVMNDAIEYSLLFRALEEMYSCNIICFSTDSNRYKADILIPRSYGVHLSSVEKYKETVFVIRRKYNDGTILKYQYELIIDSAMSRKSRFDTNNLKLFFEYYQWMTKVYIVDSSGNNIEYKPPSQPKHFTHQHIDAHGKCVGFYNEKYGILTSTSQCAPFNMPIFENHTGKVNEEKNIKKFLASSGYKIADNKINISDFVFAYLLEDVPENRRIVNMYNIQKKIAFYLHQYAIYLSSILNRTLEPSDFKISPEFDYENEVQTYQFTKKSMLIKNNKLVVPDNKTEISLRHFVSEFIKYNVITWRKFKDRIVLPNPFFDIDEFKKLPDVNIFASLSSLQKFLLNRDNREIKNTLQFSTTIPYSYMWKGESDKLVLIQNGIEDINTALGIIHEWNNNAINLYSIQNNFPDDLIKKYKHQIYMADKLGKLNSYTIIQYFLEDRKNPMYSAVLQTRKI